MKSSNKPPLEYDFSNPVITNFLKGNAVENIKHIQTCLANIDSLLDEIPEKIKSDLKIGFVSSLSFDGNCLDVMINGKGLAVKTSIEGVLKGLDESISK